jgi:glycerol-3-phosphate acyltransferase PlsY
MAYLIYPLIAVLAYLLGSVPFGYLIGRMKGIDIRTVGSCNVGATNVTRTVGKWAGKLCFFLDMLKGLVPVLTVTLLIKYKVIDDPNAIALILAAFCPIAGHMWSIFLKFTGGKGISTAGGGLLILAPWSFLTAIVLWVIIFLVSRYVSLASIIAAALMGITVIVYSALDWSPQPVAVQVYLVLIAVLAIFKHRSNIKRLLEGTENRFEKKPKVKPLDEEAAE